MSVDADGGSGIGGITDSAGEAAGSPVLSAPTHTPTQPVRRSTNRLNDRAVKGFIARVRAGEADKKKLSDGGGLFLMLTPAGTAVWRIKYRIGGRERLASAGIYPEVGLAEARERRATLRFQLRQNRDPQVERKNRAASAATFGSVAAAWLEMRRPDWSKVHFAKTSQALRRDGFPKLGNLRIAEITPALIAPVIEAIARRGSLETASKVLQNLGAIFRYAEWKGILAPNANPANAVRELLPRKREHSQRPALLTC